jgi:hypothetical protein
MRFRLAPTLAQEDPKIGWVPFRWFRTVPGDVRSFRVTRDRAGRWHAAIPRLEHKAPGRVRKVDPACTSQTCNACGHRAADNRENQAVFHRRACGHTDHADVNAARNIAVRRTVTARGGRPVGRPVNREPHLVLSSA